MNRTALITGASSGIGEAFARTLAERQFDLVLTARRLSRLETLAEQLRASTGVTVHVHACDLADPSAPAALKHFTDQADIAVDLLINNAGYGLTQTYLARDWPEHAAFMQVMMGSVAELCHLYLPGMCERRWGRVINVASLAGFMPGTRGHTQYTAVKAWMIKFSESLSLELTDQGVHVTASCPGFTTSEFHDVTGTREQMNSMPGFMWKSAEYVVDKSLAASERGDRVVITGGVNKGLALMARWLPSRWVQAMMNRQSGKFRQIDDG